MSTTTVNGYYDGVAYTVVLDDSIQPPDPLTGVVQVAPPGLIAEIEAATGERSQIHPTGTSYEIGLDSIESVLAFLVNRTQVVNVSGDLPDDIAGNEDDILDAVQ